ncbi:MAG: hypothetical protein V4543_09030 [Bacteroidota bacterium]
MTFASYTRNAGFALTACFLIALSGCSATKSGPITKTCTSESVHSVVNSMMATYGFYPQYFTSTISESTDAFTVTYTVKAKGASVGGGYVKVSKADCSIIEKKLF